MADDNNVEQSVEQSTPSTSTLTDDITELEEALVNPDGTLNFKSYRMIESVDVGYVLVRKNVFTKRFSIGLFDKKRLKKAKYKTVEENQRVQVKIVDLEDSELDAQINEMLTKVNDPNLETGIKNRANTLLKILKQEKKYRQDPSYVRQDIVLRSTVTLVRVVKKTVENSSYDLSAKFSGLKFRWLWHRAIMIPLRETTLDTRKIVADVKNSENKGEKVEIDVDYRFKIVDPVKFLNKINGEKRNPIRPVLDKCGKALDAAVRLYVTKFGVDRINTSDDDLDICLNPIFQKLENEYGLKFYVLEKIVNRDKDYQQMEKDIALSAQKKQVAANEADAQRISDQVAIEKQKKLTEIEAGKSSNEYADLIERIKQNNPGLSDAAAQKTLEAFLASKHLRQSVNIGGSVVPPISQPTVTPAAQPVQQNFGYTEEQMQELINLGVCSQKGYLSLEDSELLCAKHGIEFNGVLFHVSSLNYYDIQQIIAAKTNGKRR